MHPPVTLIIVAWNQLEKTLACLETVTALTYPRLHTILVDNGSDPPLAEAVTGRFPTVEVIRLPHNTGFAGGYNAGLRRGLKRQSDYFLLLNNDTELATGVVEHLIAEMATAPEVGLVTAKVYYAGDRQRIWTVGNRLNIFLDVRDGGENQIDHGQWSKPRDIDFAPFCGILIRREVVERVGFLDEDFFLYYEDLDYCRRARLAGYRLRLCPDAHIWHTVSASTGGLETPVKRYWLAQSSGRYFRMHGRGARMALIVPFRLASAIKITARLLLNRRGDVARAYWAGLLAGWRSGGATTPPPPWLTS
jgi:GT2 family glycosyltransferase